MILNIYCLRSSSILRYGIDHDYQRRHSALQLKNGAIHKRVHKLDGSARQGWIRDISPMREKSQSESGRVGNFQWGNSKRDARGTYVPKSKVRKSSAFETRDASAKRVRKQRFNNGYKCTENEVQGGSPPRQDVSIETRNCEVLLKMPSGKTKTTEGSVYRSPGGNYVSPFPILTTGSYSFSVRAIQVGT